MSALAADGERGIPMNVTISARKCNLRPSYKDLADKKLAKLDKFFNESADAHLTVTVEKNYHRVELTVFDAGIVFRAEQDADDMYEALDLAVDSIIRQIRKNKTRLERRLRESAFEPVEEYAEKNYDIIRHKTVNLVPMTVDEAIMEMELVGHAFFMFLNSDNGRVGVVYRRRDAGYGVIEAAN